jgi:hypothetical protein
MSAIVVVVQPLSDQPAHARWFRRRATVVAVVAPWRPGEPRDRVRADGTSSGSRFLHGRHAGGSRRTLDQRRLRWIRQPTRVAHAGSARRNRCHAETLIRGGLR